MGRKLEKNNGRKSPKSRKETDTQIKKPNEMESMEGNHIETQIQLSKVREKNENKKKKEFVMCKRTPLRLLVDFFAG